VLTQSPVSKVLSASLAIESQAFMSVRTEDLQALTTYLGFHASNGEETKIGRPRPVGQLLVGRIVFYKQPRQVSGVILYRLWPGWNGVGHSAIYLDEFGCGGLN
jgi:hypothetical protein